MGPNDDVNSLLCGDWRVFSGFEMSENTLQGGKQKCWLKCEKYLPNTNELIGEIGEDDAFFLGMRHRASKPPRAALRS